MDDFSDLLAPQGVVSDLQPGSKKALFHQIGLLAARYSGFDPRLVADRLSDRERLGSTGFGGGVAVPHGKIDRLDRVVGLFARLAAPGDFSAIDGMPVDLAFVLLSPPDAGAEHLKALARVSRRLRDRAFVAKLRGAGSADAIYALFAGGDARNAA